MSTSNKLIPVSVEYTGRVPNGSRQERKAFLAQEFAKASAVLSSFDVNVDIQALSVSAQAAFGNMPEENFQPLAKELKKKSFRLGHNPSLDATL